MLICKKHFANFLLVNDCHQNIQWDCYFVGSKIIIIDYSQYKKIYELYELGQSKQKETF